jgi:hypothetical protein
MSDNTKEQDHDPANQAKGNPHRDSCNGQESGEEIRARLLRDAHKYRLPPEIKEQILKELPPQEVMEQGYRELMEHGGYSFEEMIASLPEDLREAFDERPK